MDRRNALGWLALCLFLSPATSLVRAAEMPELSALDLTLQGNTASGAPVSFSRDELERMGTQTIVTTCPWYSGTVTFEGVPLKQLLDKVGAKGDKVVAVALNDYRTEIPMSDFDKFKVLVAFKRDGNYLQVRDKGPFFIVYPYDSDPELKSQKYYARSAWQVTSLTIR